MQKQLNIKMPVFMYTIPLLDSEFDTTPEEIFASVMAQAEFNEEKYKIELIQ